MRRAVALLALVPLLAACGSSGSSGSKPDVAACEKAMGAQYAAAGTASSSGTRPAECAGVSDTDLQAIVGRVMSGALSSATTAPAVTARSISPPAAPVSAPAQPARLTLAQAAAAYTAMTATGNQLGAALNAELGRSTPDMAKVHQLAVQLKAVYRKVLDTILHTAWPAELQPDMDALAKWTAQLVSFMDAIISAPTVAQVPQGPPDGGVPQLIRAKLGLATVPTQT